MPAHVRRFRCFQEQALQQRPEEWNRTGLQSHTKCKRQTSINHPASIFQLYCKAPWLGVLACQAVVFREFVSVGSSRVVVPN